VTGDVVVDPDLGRSKIRRFVLGDHRDLWLTLIRVPSSIWAKAAD
jgi:hypothetical protein